MPWEVVIQSSDNAELGAVAAVREKMSAALPDIKFYVEPSGLEKLAAMRERGIEFPEILRKHLEQSPASLQADFEGNDFSMQFYGFESQPLRTIRVEVRGNGNPLPALAALCRPNGWTAIDCANSQPIDPSAAAAAGWDAFRNYRDRAVSSILKRAEPG
jgi:hypothetical protein